MLLGISGAPVVQASTRAERRLVTKGNKLYTERKFMEAESIYQEALRENPQSTSARYNLGLSQLRQVKNMKDSTPKTQKLIEGARRNFNEAARQAKERPGIAAKANYNLGNMEFNMEQYQKDQKDQQQQKQQQQQQQDQKQQPQEQKINEQTAQRILQAMDSKENQTRARVNRAAKGEKGVGNGQARKRW